MTSPRTPSAQPQALHFSYEKAGLTVENQPIPWNAEAVLIEALVRFPGRSPDSQGFTFHVPGQPAIRVEAARSSDMPGLRRLFFRVAVPERTVLAELRWQDRSLGQLTLPVLDRQAFLDSLTFEEATVHVRLADDTRPCRSYVNNQGKELLASALLSTPTNLAPLTDLPLTVEIAVNGEILEKRSLHLSSGQLAARRALVTIPMKRPRRSGIFEVLWKVAGDARAQQRITAMTLNTFRRSLRISSTRFYLERAGQSLPLARVAPRSLDDLDRLGPVFLLTSAMEGMAALAECQVRVLDRRNQELLAMPAQRILVSDGPVVVAPGTLSRADLDAVFTFELWADHRRLGALALAATPSANFTGEGGFEPLAADFEWSPSAEESLRERLAQLAGTGPS